MAGTIGFVLEDGSIAPPRMPMFDVILCPFCQKKMMMGAVGKFSVVVITQAGGTDAGGDRVFVHFTCLRLLLDDLEKQMEARGQSVNG